MSARSRRRPAQRAGTTIHIKRECDQRGGACGAVSETEQGQRGRSKGSRAFDQQKRSRAQRANRIHQVCQDEDA